MEIVNLYGLLLSLMNSNHQKNTSVVLKVGIISKLIRSLRIKFHFLYIQNIEYLLKKFFNSLLLRHTSISLWFLGVGAWNLTDMYKWKIYFYFLSKNVSIINLTKI